MFGHNDESVELKVPFATITINALQKDPYVVLDHEQSPSLPGRESNEVSSGWGDESSRLQEQTSAAKAAIFAWRKSARGQLVPFPVVFVRSEFRFGIHGS